MLALLAIAGGAAWWYFRRPKVNQAGATSGEPTAGQKRLLDAGYGFGEKAGMSRADWMRRHDV
jgi:hypothetical protein